MSCTFGGRWQRFFVTDSTALFSFSLERRFKGYFPFWGLFSGCFCSQKTIFYPERNATKTIFFVFSFFS
jgi:hypothetical protein